MSRHARPSETVVAAAGGPGGGDGRIGYLETVRALSCILVVCYHAIGNDPDHGVRAAVDSWPWWTARAFDLVQMPLFAFVSGRLFALPTQDAARFGRALGRRLLRLAVPLTVVTVLFLVTMRMSGYGGVPSWPAAHLRSFGHLWFLQSSLLLTLVAAAALWVAPERQGSVAVALFAVAVVGSITVPDVEGDLFSWRGAWVLAPYFFLGRMVGIAERRRPGSVEGRGGAGALVLLALLAAAGLAGAVASGHPHAGTAATTAGTIVVALAAILAFVVTRPRWRPLEVIAGASYTIYLLHPLMLAPMRMVVAKLWSGAPVGVVIALSLAAGIAGPWLFHRWVVARVPLAAFLFEGLLPKPAARSGEGAT